jgi:hypothetical protein
MVHTFVLRIGLVALLSLSACATRYTSQVNFNPGEPLRIAVLPFVQVDQGGNVVDGDTNLLIDDVAIVSSRLQQSPAQFFQGLVQSELTRASFDVIPPGIVEAMLLHSRFNLPNAKPSKVDVAKVLQADPAQLCERVLSCDAVLYGKVTRWDRSYYGVESVATVGVDVKLVSAKTKKVLFESSAVDSDSRGLTKGPTGFSNIVIEPISGLDSKIITDLAREVVVKALEPVSGRGRPEFLKTPPPVILASAHNAPSGVIKAGQRLIVVAYGSPGNKASFGVGDIAKGVPLVERSGGHYVGEFIPLAEDSFQNAVVSVELSDQAGRKTSMRLTNAPVAVR